MSLNSGVNATHIASVSVITLCSIQYLGLWQTRIELNMSPVVSVWHGSEAIDTAIDKFSLQKVSLLRALCKSVGIQVLLREYSMDGKTRQSFYEEDIQTVFPVVKHIHPKVTAALSMCVCVNK